MKSEQFELARVKPTINQRDIRDFASQEALGKGIGEGNVGVDHVAMILLEADSAIQTVSHCCKLPLQRQEHSCSFLAGK
jgi:hypothetical protein